MRREQREAGQCVWVGLTSQVDSARLRSDVSPGARRQTGGAAGGRRARQRPGCHAFMRDTASIDNVSGVFEVDSCSEYGVSGSWVVYLLCVSRSRYGANQVNRNT